MKKIVFTIITGLIVLTFFIHLQRVQKDATPIDRLGQVLEPIKPFLEKQTIISLLADNMDYHELYYQTQFVLAPTIVDNEKIDKDVILVIEKLGGRSIKFPYTNYKIMFTNSNGTHNVAVYSKVH